jgi:Kef-type K+ transport system membrane component KefB
VEFGVTVALLELTLGIVAGNVLHLHTADWLDFLAAFASIVLTFLAGMEVDPAYMRRRLTAAVGIGIVSFVGPFVVATLVAEFVFDWTTRASLITGTALSTTSLAVVYAVLVERGLTATSVRKLLMVMSHTYADHREEQKRLRVVAFAFPPRREDAAETQLYLTARSPRR